MNNTNMKVKKTADRKAYMKEYMRQYNLKKYGLKTKQTDAEKKESLKKSHKKYYEKNKVRILERQKKTLKIKRLNRLRSKLQSLEKEINL